MKKILFLLVLLALPLMAQAKTLEDLLVEKGVISSNEARATNTTSAAKVYWDNGTKIEFPNDGFTAQLATSLGTSYAFTKKDSALKRQGLAKNTSSFEVNMAKLILSGTILNEEFTYEIDANFANSRDENGASADLEDAFIQWEPCKGMGIKSGSFVTSIARQDDIYDYGSQLPTASLASDTFAMGRMGGVRAFYGDEDETYYFSASMYNGTSSGEEHRGVDTRHAYDVSARVNVLGQMEPYLEGDIEMTQDFALNIGSAYLYAEGKEYEDILGGDSGIASRSHHVSADANVKYQGFSFHGEFFWLKDEATAYEDDVDQVGFYTQAGYFFTPEFEVAARYSYIDCDEGLGNGACAIDGFDYNYGVDDVNEAAVSLNYYFWKRNLMVQLAYIFEDQGIGAKYRDLYDTNSVKTNTWMLQFTAHL